MLRRQSARKIARLAAKLVEYQHCFGYVPTKTLRWMTENPEQAIFNLVLVNRRDFHLEHRKARKITLPRRLTFIADSTIEGVEQFSVEEHFQVDTSDSARVKICSVDETFKECFFRGLMVPTPAMTLRIQELFARNSQNWPILTEMSMDGEFEYRIGIGEFYAQLEKQGHGQPGPLVVEGYGLVNVAYIRAHTKESHGIPFGDLYAVSALWNQDKGGWEIGASPIGYPGYWRKGCRFMSNVTEASQSWADRIASRN